MAASFRDYIVLVKPIEGPNNGQELRLLTGSKLSIEAGAGADHFVGFGELPVDIIRKTNKPKFGATGMDNEETLQAIAFVGGIGGYRFNFSVTRQRPGFPTRRLLVTKCQLGDGVKILDADESGGKGDFAGLCLDILYSPRVAVPPTSIFAKTNGR